jgi:hypothetical protein
MILPPAVEKRRCGGRAPVKRSEYFRRFHGTYPGILQTLNGETKKEMSCNHQK